MRSQREWLPDEPAVAALLEAIYRVDLDESAWSSGVTGAFGDAIGDRGIVGGFCFDASKSSVLATWAGSSAYPPAHAWLAQSERAALPAQVVDLVVRLLSERPRVASARSVLGSSFAPMAERLGAEALLPMSDAWSLIGADLSRRGYFLSVATSTPVGPLPPPLIRQWTRVAAHLSAAFCLRHSLARGEAPGEAVLTPDGKLLHAEGCARTPPARAALRLAVRGIDAARGRLRKHPDESLEAWQAVVSGRWTLVDAHERDGKRYLLARVNQLRAPGDPALSPRERQVVALVWEGASNKEIAYRLGIGEPAVGSYLRRARQKLGARCRAEVASLGDPLFASRAGEPGGDL